MNKKGAVITLTSLIIMNQLSDIPVTYAQDLTSSVDNQQVADKQSKQVVYLVNGEGDLDSGNGTKENPYQNIRTALKEVSDGGVIKLKGRVSYTKYEQHPVNLSALPLTITKNVTFEGENPTTDGITSRAPIQLAANVTFKNMRLEMVNNNQIMPGVQEPAPTPADIGVFKSGRTIYTAGYTLTLDNVNTRIGSNMDQIDDRPFISGGTYQDRGKIGPKSTVNITNANAETRIYSIYAGDYWLTRNHPFELNLDQTTTNKTIIDSTIHTGGIIFPYTGDVEVNLAGTTTNLEFDNNKHTGNTDLHIKGLAYFDNLKLNKIRNLTLSNKVCIVPKSNELFKVDNLTITDDALLDFTEISGNPKISGNFVGAADSSNTGAIVLGRNQTLEVQGSATGFTRLNTHNRITPQTLKQNHSYVTAQKDSTANFIISPVLGQENLGLTVVQSISDNNLATWKVTGNISQEFKDFSWESGQDQLINPKPMDEYSFPIQYVNEHGEVYVPDDFSDFSIALEKKDGTILTEETDTDLDFIVFFGMDGEIILGLVQVIDSAGGSHTEYTGDIILTLKNKTTNKEIKKTVTILRNAQDLTGNVTLSGTPKVGETLTVNTTNLSQDAKDLKYKWYVDGKEVADTTESTFNLREDYIGKSIKVEVRSSNYAGVLTSSELIVVDNKLSGTVSLTGTPEAGQTLTANLENLQKDAQLSYQWYVGDEAINSATQPTFLVSATYAGKPIRVEVKASNYSGTLSSQTVTVSKTQLMGRIEIIGTPKVGNTLTVKTNVPSEAMNLTYQWYVDGVAVDGASDATFILKTEHIGKDVTVAVGASNYVGALVSTKVTISKSDLTGAVEVTGKPQIGEILTAKIIDLPQEATNLSYQWYIDGVAVSGANQPTFKLEKEHLQKKIKVEVTDTNYTGAVLSIEVKVQPRSNQAPTITGLESITLKLSEVSQFQALDGVVVTDDYDQNLVPTVKGIIETPKPGQNLTSTLTYTVTDSDGNTTTLPRLVTVTNQLPTIQANSLTIKVGEVIDLLTDSRINLLANDHEDGDLISKVQVTKPDDLDLSNPQEGSYPITYSVTDLDGNAKTVTITLNVQSSKSPVINGVSSVTLKVGEVDSFNPLTGITVTDDIDSDLKVTVSGTIEKPQAGQVLTSTLTYEVKDSSGNVTTVERLITVTNQLPVLQVTPITIKANQVIDLLTDTRLQLLAKDHEDGDLTSKIKIEDLDGLNSQQPTVGIYDITYSVTDSDGNKVKQKVTVMVTSNEFPTFTGVESLTIVSGDRFNPLDGVTAFDKEDGIISSIQVIGSIDTYQIGEQSITYQVTDLDGNVATITRLITVVYKTETSSDSSVSEVFVPQNKAQLTQLIEELKSLDSEATVIDVKEEAEYYIYKIKVRSKVYAMTKSTTDSEYFIEFKVSKSIQSEPILPGLTPDNGGNETSKPEQAPDNGENETLKPEKLPTTGYVGTMNYLGGLFITLGSLLMFKKKKK